MIDLSACMRVLALIILPWSIEKKLMILEKAGRKIPGLLSDMIIIFCLFFVSKINQTIILYDGTMKETKSCIGGFVDEIYKKRSPNYQ